MKRKMKKTAAFALLAGVLTAANSMTAFAGAWQQDARGWWYQKDDGSYYKNEWQWIDGNNDGVSESYYFTNEGYLLTNTATPDGYQVNENGAWVENGVVQTKSSNQGNPVLHVDGLYNYYKSEIYVKNKQTGAYELYRATKQFDKNVDSNVYENEVWYERSSLGLAADLSYIEYTVKTAGSNDIIFEGTEPLWHFTLQGQALIPAYYERNGQRMEADLSNSDEVSCDGQTLIFASEEHVTEGYALNNALGLVGDVMVKEVYKKK